MSIAEKVTRLITAHEDIITALTNKGVTATGHGFEDFADDIGSIETGGASNIVTGSFTAGSGGTSTENHTLTIPYVGNGYPIAGIIVLAGGHKSESGDTSDWGTYSGRYRCGLWMFMKNHPDEEPIYNNTSTAMTNQTSIAVVYKNNTNYPYLHAFGSEIEANPFQATAAVANSVGTMIKFRNHTTIEYRSSISGTQAYSLAAGLTYNYWFIYSE